MNLALEVPNIKKGVNIKKFEKNGSITLFGYYLKLKYNDFIEFNFYEAQEDYGQRECDIEIKKGITNNNGIDINSFYKIKVLDTILFKTVFVADIDKFKENMTENDKKILGDNLDRFYQVSEVYLNVELTKLDTDKLEYCNNLIKTIEDIINK